MTNKERVEMLINRIEADLKKLGRLTGKNHISAFVIDDFYSFRAVKDEDENDIAIDVTRRGEEEI